MAKDLIKKAKKVLLKTGANAGYAAIGVGIGAGKLAYDVASKAIYNKKRISELKSEVEKQSELYKMIYERKKTLIDSGIVSGTFIADLNLDFIDLDIANKGLTTIIEGATDTADKGFNLDINFPIISLGLIAFSTYREKDKSIFQKSYSFGKRSVKSMAAYGAGNLIMRATGVWWTSVLGAIATRFLADGGRANRKTYQKLKEIVSDNEKLMNKYKKL